MCCPFPCCEREKLHRETPFSGHLKEIDIERQSVDLGMPHFRLTKGSQQSIASLAMPRSAVTVIGKANDGKLSSALNWLCIKSLGTAKEMLKMPHYALPDLLP